MLASTGLTTFCPRRAPQAALADANLSGSGLLCLLLQKVQSDLLEREGRGERNGERRLKLLACFEITGAPFAPSVRGQECLLSTFYGLGTVPGAGNPAVNKTDRNSCSCGADVLAVGR